MTGESTITGKVLRVGGAWCASFVQLETALDDSVGGAVDLTVCRGGEELAVSVAVDDLHSLTPSRYLEVGGGPASLARTVRSLARWTEDAWKSPDARVET